MLSTIINQLRSYKHNAYISNCVKRGMKIGANTDIMTGCYFDYNYCYLISIGNNCTLSNSVFVLAHDASMYKFLGFTKIAPVVIHNNCFIGARTIILPGVTIGPNAIVGAGSIVTNNIQPNSVAGGNPARAIKTLDDFLQFHKKRFTKTTSAILEDVYAQHPEVNEFLYVVKRNEAMYKSSTMTRDETDKGLPI